MRKLKVRLVEAWLRTRVRSKCKVDGEIVFVLMERTMLERPDITDREYAFLVSQKIPLSHVFDARGRAATAWEADAKREGLLFGLSEPCYRGHRLRSRTGHCIECDTARIAYMQRFAAPGYVYLAVSKSEQLIKVGSCNDPTERESKLNYDAYGGANDWQIIAWCKTTTMGQVEFDIHKTLANLSVERVYRKDGIDRVARELFHYEIVRVWQVYRSRIERIDEKSKWRHPKLASFAK